MFETSLFALEIQIHFILQGGEGCRFALPLDWEMIQRLRNQVAIVGCSMSPCVARDLEILQRLESSMFAD